MQRALRPKTVQLILACGARGSSVPWLVAAWVARLRD